MGIRVLPPEVASRIAAGEVIERPASVLKELLENSLDAGAAKIQCVLSGAGRELLRVQDDGCGIPKGELRLAFQRHSTSKISSFEDLETLASYGFRGEALYAIGSVSRVKLQSQGWMVELEGGKLLGEHEAPPVPGTTVEVRDLFFNTPARHKFLKSEASEKGRLLRTLEEAALAHPEVAFLLRSEGGDLLRLPPEADGEQGRAARIRSLLGPDLGAPLAETRSAPQPHTKLQIHYSPPDRLVHSRNFQFFFVNLRPVRSQLLQQALYRAYGPYRTPDRHPACVLYLEMPPSQYDVNVHPAKLEIRFKADNEVFELVRTTLETSLRGTRPVPSLLREGPRVRRSGDVIGVREQEEPYLPSPLPSPLSVVEVQGEGDPAWYTPPFRYLGQIEAAYLVFEASGGILLMDQHAAQERVLYERYLADLQGGRPQTQKLMLPVCVELPASELPGVAGRRDELTRLGFDVEAMGPTTLALRGVPAAFQEAEDSSWAELAQRLCDETRSAAASHQELKKERVALLACKRAVKAHDRLGAEEALRLLHELRSAKDPATCPHGRPAVIRLSRDELARRFKRPGPP